MLQSRAPAPVGVDPRHQALQKQHEAMIQLIVAEKCKGGKRRSVLTTNQHNAAWLERFDVVVRNFPEIVEAYRMSGQVDYMLRVVVPDIESYDRFYKAFIGQIDLTDVSSSFAMEQIKFTTALPLAFAAAASGKRAREEA